MTNSTMNSGYASSYNSPGYGGLNSTAGYGGVGSYGGMNSYGGLGGYGGGYGGYGGGYGGYGGYGGGFGSSYGGYGMSRFGGGYGGGMMGGPMDPNSQLGFLHTFSQTVGSLGQITEVREGVLCASDDRSPAVRSHERLAYAWLQMLGMNAEALHFCVGSFVNFVERIGAMCAGMASMVTPRPQYPPGHPMHGTACSGRVKRMSGGSGD